jgi:hypothetical protein
MKTIDTLLLLALPASGKSELRRYLGSVDPEVASRDFGLGPTVQLDDYPYVHLMRRISEEALRLGAPPVFFAANDQPFLDGRDWATLTALINEDHAALGTAPAVPRQPTIWILERLTTARRSAGLPGVLDELPGSALRTLESRLDQEVAELADQRSATLRAYEPGLSTVLIEFARGGPEGAVAPLREPDGYAYSLSRLSPAILRRSRVLYVWVTPEDSRRRNEERAHPGPAGDASILQHGVPGDVMRQNYGSDDFLWLLDRGGGDAVDVSADGDTYRLPTAVFDNRADHTSFLRAEPDSWDPGRVAALHEALAEAFEAFDDSRS